MNTTYKALLKKLPFLHHALLFLAMASLTRFVLATRTGFDAMPLDLWPGFMLRGLLADVLVVCWLLVPGFVWAAVTPSRWRETRWQNPIKLVLFGLNAVALVFIAFSEFTFWEEFSTRFNFIAVDYLIYTQEVIGNLRESYPIGWMFAAIAAIAVALTWAFRGPILSLPATGHTRKARLVFLALALVLPTLSWKLSDIDRMAFSNNAYANELSGNGVMTFGAAFRRNELDYKRFYATLEDEQVLKTLSDLGVERHLLGQALKAKHEPSEAFDATRIPFKHAPKHVVMIMVESFSASFMGSFGNTKNITPRLDELAQNGLLFTQLYATGTRTVRGLEALSLGTPPIPGQSIVRRPNNDGLATLGEVLRPQGFEPMFIYGGYGYFDNMNAFFQGNSYKVIDRTEFPKESIGFENVWGVGDEFLFDNVLTQLDKTHQSGKRMLAQVMTTSNHRPYTYADGRIDIPSPGGREGAVKYTDFSIGHFLDQAKTKPWFADTLFVIVADHCASAAGKTKLPVPGYHIPMIMYAPKLLKPGKYTELVSQIDIAPTLIDVLGVEGDDHFYGRSVFEQGKDFQRRAFISNYQELGYLSQNQLTVLGPKQKVETFNIAKDGSATPTEVNPKLRDEAIAYYQSAFQAFKTGALKFK
jgi:phosphoglycerol transferase MdoB-like AlkP superfamily enzyme